MMFSSNVLRFCLLALVLAQRPKAGRTRETAPAAEPQVTNSDSDGTETPSTNSAPSMGPIGAGIGFCVLFAGVVVYLCKKDYDEKQHEKAKAAAEAKALEEAEEKKPNPLLDGEKDTHFNGVELASLTSLETASTKGEGAQEAEVADRV